jgi:hypothetical protein
LCRSLAGVGTADNWSIARNGRIIEQIQIVTTHNLAQLVDGLSLRSSLRPIIPKLVEQCLASAIAELQRPLPVTKPNHTRLIRRKNAAYAWRQMVFFIALAEPATRESVLLAARQAIAAAEDGVRMLLQPYIEGVVASAAGKALGPGDERRFLGWL